MIKIENVTGIDVNGDINLNAIYQGKKVDILAVIENKQFTSCMYIYNIETEEEIEEELDHNDWIEIHNYLESNNYTICSELEVN